MDLVVREGRRIIGIEVKSATAGRLRSGSDAFADAFKPQRTLLVDGDGLRRRLSHPACTSWR
ncbi:MAG: hypothetical protein EA404_11340 [Spirochaetaceae bacterium]|nr:MAG: hypothetical protein EA404_11340 [Spirochaetaceae bacterium]